MAHKSTVPSNRKKYARIPDIAKALVASGAAPSKTAAAHMVSSLVEFINKSIAAGRPVAIHRLGTFTWRTIPARAARKPTAKQLKAGIKKIPASKASWATSFRSAAAARSPK